MLEVRKKTKPIVAMRRIICGGDTPSHWHIYLLYLLFFRYSYNLPQNDFYPNWLALFRGM